MSNVVVLGTSDSIVAVMASAPATTQPSFVSSWVDAVANVTSSSKGTLNGTSEVTVVPAPTSDERQVDFVRIYNSDTAVSVITVKIANSTNRYPLGTWAVSANGFVDVLTTLSGSVAIFDRLSNLANSELTISAAATAVTAQWNRCYATSAAYALTLPPVLASAGKIVGVRIDSSSTYNVTVTGNSTDLIDGSNTYLMIPKEVCEFKSDGTTWQRISNNSPSGTWTPTVANYSGTITSIIGTYAKNGNVMSITVNITGTSLSFTPLATTISCPFNPVGISILNGFIGSTATMSSPGPVLYPGTGLFYFPTISSQTYIRFSGSVFFI